MKTLLQNWNIEKLKIERFKEPAGTKSTFRVNGTLPDGTRIRKRFDTEQQAKEERRKLAIAVESQVEDGEYRYTLLSRDQERDALVALKSLNNEFAEKKSLGAAVEFFIANYKSESIEEKKVEDALVVYEDDLRNREISEAYLKSTMSRLRRMNKTWGERLVSDITRDEAYDWIYCKQPEQIGPWDKTKRKAITSTERKTEYAALSGFFNFCKEFNYCLSSPLEKVRTPHKSTKDPKAYSPEQARRIMEAAQKHEEMIPKADSSVPYFALGLFASCRPDEIKRLDWKDFCWDEGEELVRVKGKGRGVRRRTVELPYNCIAWVKPYAKDSGSVYPGNGKKVIQRVYAIAGFRINPKYLDCKNHEQLWPLVKDAYDKSRSKPIGDGLRHSATTYRLKVIKSDGAVALWSGNSASMIHDHYKGLRTNKEAEEYWNILPAESDQAVYLIS
jgi:integrase